MAGVLIVLLSWIFGCSKKSKNTIPTLPFLDNLGDAVQVPAPEGFTFRNFLFSPDRREVFVLAYGAAGEPERMPYRLLKLDMQGRTVSNLDLPRREWVPRAAMWRNAEQRLMLMMSESILTVEEASLKVVDEWRIVSVRNFLPQRKLDQLIPSEQRQAYAEALAKVRASHPEAEVYKPPKGREAFVVIGKSAWVVLDQEPGKDDEQLEEEGSELADGDIRLRCTKAAVIGTRLRYPNYLNINVKHFELGTGLSRKLYRFQTTDQDGRDLDLYVADDRRLATADGAVWLRHEKRIFRIPPIQ